MPTASDHIDVLMTRLTSGEYTWFCMVCGERASGSGEGYDEWKVAHREVCPVDAAGATDKEIAR